MAVVLVRHDLPVDEAIRDRRSDLEVVAAADRAAVLDRLPAADVLVTNPTNWDDAYLDGLDGGDWLQTTSAGYAAFPVETLDDRGVHFTTAAGLHDDTVAEHAFALALALSRRLPVYHGRQRTHRWDRSDSDRLTDWAGDTLTVLGLGHIGSAVARRGLAFGMAVNGVKRDPSAHDGTLDDDRVLGPDGLPSVLPETDLLVLAVPLTQETRGLVDGTVIGTLPDTAVLVNVSRGPVVDQDALVDALGAGRLGGAGLDVFEPEPLPADSPLWDAENVVLTPHVGGRSDAFVPRFVGLFAENYVRWAAGEPMRNQRAGP